MTSAELIARVRELDERDNQGDYWEVTLRAMQLADAIEQVTREKSEQHDEMTDWILVADGVKHDWRCCHGEADTPKCLRCQLEQVTQERDRAREIADRLRDNAGISLTERGKLLQEMDSWPTPSV